jgi:EF-P beta-lysylation protein EpmB
MKTFTDINKLIKFLEIDKINEKKILKKSSFKLLLPFSLAKKIKKNDITDPIFRQFVPLVDEEKNFENTSIDPLNEKSFKKNNLLKKYKNRALLIASNSCNVHCRYCFRRYFEKNKSSNFDKEIKLIKNDKSLNEIILSGGDPLSLSNEKLKDLLLKLNEIDHLKIIRFHTRYIVGDPKRIDSEFLKILKLIKKQIVFVFHINHKNELDDSHFKLFKKLNKNSYLMFNQSVLLKNVNDNKKDLYELNLLLFENKVVPYYLHQLDDVKGANHFKVDIKKGKNLLKELKEELSGFMVFRYVKEIPFEKNKTLIS